MATRYAVASGNWSNTTTVWSDTDGGAAGNFVPVNNDTFVISAGVSVLMDADQSAFANGMASINYIRGSSGTPGMLYFKDSTNGYLKIATGASIQGTTGTNKGRILANSDGVWGNTGALSSSNTAVIEFITNAKMQLTYLEIALYASHPTVKYLNTYYNSSSTYFTFDGATAVDPATDTITLGAAPPGNGAYVTFKPAAGATLPTGIVENATYLVRNRATPANTMQIGHGTSGSVMNITADGSGTIAMYTNYTTSNITQTFSVFEDISADAYWSTTSGFNRVILCGVNNYNVNAGNDNQRGTITSKTSNSITISFTNSGNNLDSTQFVPARLYLISRNVSLRTTCTSAVNIVDFNNTNGTCVLDCEMINTASHGSSTQTSNNGYVVYNHSGTPTVKGIAACMAGLLHTVGSAFTHEGIVISGNYGMQNCNGAFAANGEYVGIGYAVYSCTGNFTFGGNIYGSSYVAQGSNGSPTLNGTAYGCYSVADSWTTGVYTIHTTAYNCYSLVSSAGFFTSDSVVHGPAYGINASIYPFTFTGTIHGNRNAALYACNGTFVFNGTIMGGVTGLSTCTGAGTVSGTMDTLTSYGFTTCTGPIKCLNLTMSNVATYGFYITPNAMCSNCTFSGNSSDVLISTSIGHGPHMYIRSFKHNGVANDTRMWGPGGTMTHETTEIPVGKTYSHKFTFTSALYALLMEWPIYRPTNGTISIPVYAKNVVSSLTEAERIKWAIVDIASDPLAHNGASYLDSFTSADSADWQSDTLTYTKVDDRPLVLRVWATRASGNAYVYSEVMEGSAPASAGSSYGY